MAGADSSSGNSPEPSIVHCLVLLFMYMFFSCMKFLASPDSKFFADKC